MDGVLIFYKLRVFSLGVKNVHTELNIHLYEVLCLSVKLPVSNVFQNGSPNINDKLYSMYGHSS